MARKGIWGDIDKLLESGQTPQLILPKSLKLQRTTGRPVGRPRLSDRERRPRMATPTGNRMRCQAFGCRTRIAKNAVALVCSERCAKELLTYVTLVKDILEGRVNAREYPGYYRSTWKKRKT